MASCSIAHRTQRGSSSTARIGEELVAVASGFDSDAACTFQWKQCDTLHGTYSNITGAVGIVWKVPARTVDGVSLSGRYLMASASGLVASEAASADSGAATVSPQRTGGKGGAQKSNGPVVVFRAARGSQNARRVRGLRA